MDRDTIRWDGHEIGGKRVFIIAEVGINHNGDLHLARELLEKAKESGADAVKLQTYKTERRVQTGSPIFDLLKRCELSYDEQRQLFSLGRDLDLVVFSTPFDEEAVDFLQDEGVPLMKVASFDVVNGTLLEKIASTGRPVIMSRGMATLEELDRALKVFDEKGIPCALLHCVSAYPVQSVMDLNLSMIPFLRERYKRIIGYSDHTLGMEVAVWAVAAGALIVEKHFTLSTSMEGPDHALSADPKTMKEMVSSIRRVESALGAPVSGPVEAEKDILQYRRES